LSLKKIDKAVTLSVDKYCGVMEMFRQFSTVTTAIHIHNS
jgi:putative redox protein